jgi:hypothetical protein
MLLVTVLWVVVDGEVSPAAAIDRWVGNAVGPQGITLAFTVLVDPGRSASWEWRFGNLQVASGPLAATVSGSTVKGTLFLTGGAIFDPPFCCRPCNFSGTIAGNRVDGVFDPVSCEGEGTFFLVKQ